METPILTLQMKAELDLLEKCTIVLRDFLQDFEEINHLVEGEMYTDQQLMTYLLMGGVEAYNSIPPISLRANLVGFPSLNLLIEGGAIFALKSSIFRYRRNAMNYSDAGVQVAVEEKADEYERTVQRMLQEWMLSAKSIKQSVNLESCYGAGLNSEYLNLFVVGRRTRKV